MDKTEIVTAVNEILVNEFELESDGLKPETEIRGDLQLDSLDAVDLIVALDKRFKIRIPEDKARAVKTLSDIYDFLDGALNSSSAGAESSAD